MTLCLGSNFLRLGRLGVLSLALAAIGQPSPAQQLGADGPDFWAVSGLREGSSLNVRAEPSASANVLIRVSPGTVLRNLGCTGERDARWCQVESPDGLAIKGWVAGRYLVETAAPGPADALVAGTPYNATGEIACVLVATPEVSSCPFGVIRAPNGLASIFITRPGTAEDRLLEFRNGEPVAPAGVTMTSRREADITVVNLDDGAEIYSIVDIIYLGD